VSTSRSDCDGSGLRIEIIPRSVWAEDQRFVVRFNDNYPEMLQLRFDAPSFRPNKHFVCALAIHDQPGGSDHTVLVENNFVHNTIHGAAIVG
jgi:hypothetical protein